MTKSALQLRPKAMDAIDRLMDTTVAPIAYSAPPTESEAERLLRIAEASTGVRLRHQFFAWTQGSLQSMLPHDGLICFLNNVGTGTVQPNIDFFSTQVVAGHHREFVFRTADGLTTQLLRRWLANDRQPVTCMLDNMGLRGEDVSNKRLFLPPFSWVSVHGIPGGHVGAMCLFALMGTEQEPRPRIGRSLELLIPYLCSAWSRVQSEAAVPAAPRRDTPRAVKLTLRQIEIMTWVRDGKSNIEIGLILGISALTVKNHVQTILRRLNVQNRAQAVAKCLSLNLLKSR